MAPARTKTSFHGKIVESHAMTIGATTVPIEPPAVQRLLAVARWRFSNQTVTATICPAKIVGSASPSSPRKNANCSILVERPPPMQAADHARMPRNITFFGPNRSTRMKIVTTIIHFRFSGLFSRFMRVVGCMGLRVG